MIVNLTSSTLTLLLSKKKAFQNKNRYFNSIKMFVSGVLAASTVTLVLDKLVNELS